MDKLDVVAKHWSQREPQRDESNFYMSPLTRAYIIENSYGAEIAERYRADSYFAENIFIDQYLQGRAVRSVMSLCCGFGSVERHFLTRLTGVKRCLGVDVATRALDIARQRASEDKERFGCITYQCADLNTYEWDEGTYDLVIANGALHHITNLEGAIEGIHRSLRPGGILYACEYVGPNYQDHSAEQLRLINAAAYLLPHELRLRRGYSFTNWTWLFYAVSKLSTLTGIDTPTDWPYWKRAALAVARLITPRMKEDVFEFGAVHISPKKRYQLMDPSECVRSSDIIPQIRKIFPDVEVRPLGGGILRHALDANFYRYYDENDPRHRSRYELICAVERHLMRTGDIGIENAFIIARK